MRVLVACEFSGIVRDAFIARGHDAISCDLLPTERPGPHVQGDVTELLNHNWDLLIAHPPCTYLAVSGASWWSGTPEQARAEDFFMMFAETRIPKYAIENPIGSISTYWRKPDQIIQPWQFGHGETKATCLWIDNLPLLQPTNIVDGREPRTWMMPGKGAARAKARSVTYQGIADAMADQWGSL